METSKYEKRRGRAKKRVEALRTAGLPLDSTEFISSMNNVSPSPSSSISEGLDLFPDSPLHRYLSISNSRAASQLASLAVPPEPSRSDMLAHLW